MESDAQLNERTIEVKEVYLPEFIGQLKEEDQAIAVVAHSRFLWSISAQKFDDKHYPLEVEWFKNCEARFL